MRFHSFLSGSGLRFGFAFPFPNASLKILPILTILLCGQAGSAPQFAVDMANRAPVFIPAPTDYGDHEFDFVGYLKTGAKITFRSPIFREDSVTEFVLTSERTRSRSSGLDTAKKYPGDFDSLYAIVIKTVYNGVGNGYSETLGNYRMDTARYAAMRCGKEWIFNSISGKISLYTAEPAVERYSRMKFGEDSIRYYDEEALRKKLYGNEGSARLLHYKTLGNGIGIMMLIGGLGTAFVGFQNSDKVVSDGQGGLKHEFVASPAIWAGLGITAGAAIPYLLVKDNFAKAVYTYNF
jgi:hypothetical protein